MNGFKKKIIFFLVLFYQHSNKNIDIILPVISFLLTIFYNIHEHSGNKNINIDSQNKIIITKNIENYLHKDHQILLNHISFIEKNWDKVNTAIQSAVITTLIHLSAKKNEKEDSIKWLFSFLFFNVEFITINYIKESFRKNDNENINKKINNIFNHSIKNNFLTLYISLILNPSDENKKILDQMYTLYDKIYKIQKNINQLEKNNFKKISYDSTKNINNIIQKINNHNPLITILSTEFHNQISTIENLLKQCIQIDADIKNYILSYKEEIEQEDLINILEIKKDITTIIKTTPSVKLTPEEINHFSANMVQLKKKIIHLKNIKESFGYLFIKQVRDKITRLTEDNLNNVAKEALKKLKNLTDQISFENIYQYLSTDSFLNNIKDLDNQLNKINTQKKILNEIILTDIHKILTNKNINLAYLEKQIPLYEKEIKKINLNNAEDILKNYIKTFDEDIKKYTIFIESSLCKKHIALYNKIYTQYEFLKEKHFSEKKTHQYLKSTQLLINNSNAIIEKNISDLEKHTEDISSIITVLKEIAIEKKTITDTIEKINQYLCLQIFKNFPKEPNINEKNYYYLNYNELINYQNDLKETKELLAKNNNILYVIEKQLHEYFLNNNEIKKIINLIELLSIYKPYIKNSEKYKEIENTLKVLLSKKIEYNNNNFYNDYIQETIESLIHESRNFLEIIKQQYKNYLENEKYNTQFNDIIKNLPEIELYDKGSNKFILNQRNLFDNCLLKILNDSSTSQSNYNNIKKIIHETENYCNLVTIEKKKIEKIISIMNDQKKNAKSFASFNKNEINSIDKNYDQLRHNIHSDFYSFLSNPKIKLDESKYITCIDNLKLMLIILDKNIIKIENTLKKVDNERIKIEEEENKYKNLLSKYQIIEDQDFFINVINAINTKIKHLTQHRIEITNKINNLSSLYTNSLNNNAYNIDDIIDLKKKYYDNNKNRKKIICNKIKKKLVEHLKQIPDEKKAEYTDTIKMTENKLTECDSYSIEIINKISNTINQNLESLLKN